MNREIIQEKIQHSLNAELSGVHTSPLEHDRMYENAIGGTKVKKKITTGVILAMALTLATITALAIALLSPKEIIETKAVPMAQNSTQENYDYEELAELMQVLNENGITLDEGSRLMKAFESGHGFWEEDTIREICLTTFGNDIATWSVEQQHWYGEMMVSIGVWDKNGFLLPGPDDLTETEARELAAKALYEAYGVDLPLISDDEWLVTVGFSEDLDEDGQTDHVGWKVIYSHQVTPSATVCSVDFDRDGTIIDISYHDEPELNEAGEKMMATLQVAWTNEQESISQYGEDMYFWPDEVKVATYGTPYAIPAPGELDHAFVYVETFIQEKYGEDALIKLGNYQIGYLFEYLDNDEISAEQLRWDIMITTDPEFLSDGYRVQFQLLRQHETGNEEVLDLIVDRASYGMG